MVCWHIRDMRSESRTNLFGKHLANIWNCTSPHSTQMFFWHVFGSIWFLQLWEEKSLELIMSVSICASGQGTKNFDRYHEFQVFIYSILNEIISSTIVYDQDANRSRGFILVALGAPLNFIAMLYSVFPICGNIDLYLDPFQELLKERFTLQALHWSTD